MQDGFLSSGSWTHDIKIMHNMSSGGYVGFPPRRPRFEPLSGHAICGRKNGTVTGFLRVFRFLLPIIPPIAPHWSWSIICGWWNRPNSDRRTKWTQSQYLLCIWSISFYLNVPDFQGNLCNPKVPENIWRRKVPVNSRIFHSGLDNPNLVKERRQR
jgi:hypothetical protein